MNSLYQKYHGKPGIGVHGLPGKQGNAGNGIFIGFINDFFDSTDISVNTIVKIGQRIINNQEFTADYTKYAKWRKQSYMDASAANSADNTYYSISEDTFLQEAKSLYYSGRTDTSILSNGKQVTYDIMDNKEDTDNIYKDDTSLIHESPKTDRYVFNQIYNIVQGDKSYVQLYEYNKDENGKFTNEPKYDVRIDINHITYEPEDVVKIFGGYAPYNSSIYGSNDINQEDIMKFFNYIQTQSLPGFENYKWWRESNYNNSDNKSLFERISFNITRESALKEYTREDLPDTYFDADSPYYNASTYAVGVDSHYAINDISGNVIVFDHNNREQLPKATPIFPHIDSSSLLKVYIDYDNQPIVKDFFLTQYVHVTARTLPPGVLTEAFVDDYGYTQIGLDIYDPSINETLELKSDDEHIQYYKFNETLLYNILDKKRQETLKDFSRNYRHIAKDFLENYEVTINHYKNNGATLADSTVRWSTNDYEKISIPTTLSNKYQPGDILYFYIDEKQFAKDNQVQYMTTLTEDLMNCDINTLIKTAKSIEPFKYQTVFKNNNRINIFDNVNILKDNISNNPAEKYYMRSFGNIISENADDTMLLASKEVDNKYNQLQLISYEKSDSSTFMSFDSSIIDDFMNYQISSDSVIKFDNLYIKDNIFLTNLEAKKVLFDEHIKYSDDNCLDALSTDNIAVKVNLGDIYGDGLYTSFNTYVFKFDKSKFITEEQYYSDYQVGYIIYIDDEINDEIGDKIDDNIYDEMLYGNNENSFTIELDPITDTKVLSKHTDQSITYNILVYIRKIQGFNIFSHTTSLTCKINYIDTNKITQPDYILTVNNDGTDISGDDTENIVFSISGITVNGSDNVIFDVSANSDDIVIDSVFFNNKEMNVNYNFWNWTDNENDRDEVVNRLKSNITWMEVTPVTDAVLYEKGHKQFILAVDDNIPDIIYTNKDIRVTTNNVADFMHTFNDADTKNDDNFDYSDIFYDVDSNIQCTLFDRIMEEATVSMAAPRTINTAVKYHFENGNTNQYTLHYENFTIKQPGFSDPRTIPQVKLYMHTDIATLENYNTVQNGILCNQFQTFMDINISDFDYDSWGKYIANNDDATLELEISNIPNDLEWQQSLSVSQPRKRATIKILPDDQVILSDDNIDDNIKYNNCVKLSINVFKNTTNKSIGNLNQNDIEALTDAFKDKCELSIEHNIMSSILGRQITENEMLGGYILLSNEICKGLKEPQNIYSGIFENIKIRLHDLTIDDVQDPIYMQVMLEFGNPVISNLYLQFAVTKLTIHYKSLNNNGELAESTFSTYTDKNNIVDTYLHQIEDYKETYRFISNKLDLMINPISVIACPPEVETELTYLSGSVKKTGSEDQIKLAMKFFGNGLYSNPAIMNLNAALMRNNQLLDLKGLQLKYKHLQDNVKYISFTCLDLINSVNNVSDNYVFKYADYESILTKSKQYEPINNKNYLSVIYHSTLMNPKLREDKRSFYYNEKLYLESKYDQYNKNCPVFISQEHNWEVRNDDIMAAIDTWNFEYQSQKDLKENTKVFNGMINKFGNGYMYLPDEIDTNLYEKNGILSLSEIKEYNNDTLYDKIDYFNIGTPTPVNMNTPAAGKYFRVPLYHMSWEYPVYDGNNIIPYYIVSMFDYLMISKRNEGVIQTFDLNNYNMRLLASLSNIIPYNVLFNISPRMTFNDDTETLNMFMLRRPSIEDDTDLSESCVESCYKLNTRYYNTTDAIPTYFPKTYNLP